MGNLAAIHSAGSKRASLPVEVVFIGASQAIQLAVCDLMRVGAGFQPLLPAKIAMEKNNGMG